MLVSLICQYHFSIIVQSEFSKADFLQSLEGEHTSSSQAYETQEAEESWGLTHQVNFCLSLFSTWGPALNCTWCLENKLAVFCLTGCTELQEGAHKFVKQTRRMVPVFNLIFLQNSEVIQCHLFLGLYRQIIRMLAQDLVFWFVIPQLQLIYQISNFPNVDVVIIFPVLFGSISLKIYFSPFLLTSHFSIQPVIEFHMSRK